MSDIFVESGSESYTVSSKSFSGLTAFDHNFDKIASRIDGLNKKANQKEYSKALENVKALRNGVTFDPVKKEVVPIVSPSLVSRQDQLKRDKEARDYTRHSQDPDFIDRIMLQAYGRLDGCPHLNSFLRSSGVCRTDDVTGSVFFARELEYLMAVSKDVLYPAANYNQIWGVNSEANPGAERVTWSSYDYQCTPTIGDGERTTAPTVNATGAQFSYIPETIRASWRITFQAIRNMLFANKSLDSMLAQGCRMSVEQMIDKMAFIGYSALGYPGLFSINGATAIPASTVGTSTTFAQKVASGDVAAIQSDLLSVVSYIISNSKGTQAPDTLVLPIDTYILLFGTPRSDNSDTTIGSYFMQNNPSVTRVFWSQWASTVASGSQALAMFDSSSSRIETLITMPYVQHAPTIIDTSYQIQTETRYAGIACYYPNAVAYMTGI